MSNSKLRLLQNLLKGPAIMVLHATYEDDVPEVVCESLPKDVATHFSGILEIPFLLQTRPASTAKGCDGDKPSL
jgi:hypothetical protein